MPQSLSTRAVGSPIGTAGKFAPSQRVMRVVPLSAFFLEPDEDCEDDEKERRLTGFRRKKKNQVAKRQKNADNDKKKADANPASGGDAKSADAAVAGKRQSTAGPQGAGSGLGAGAQESVTMSGGTPLVAPGGATRAASFSGGASKLGATGKGTGTGNVAQYPVPLGSKRRRRRKQERLDRWIHRLGKMVL